MAEDEFAGLLAVQEGVVSRRQLRQQLGAAAHDVRRLLRRRELTVVHPGVYVGHSGPLTWEQRAWAAVLYYWPAALARQSDLPRPVVDGPIHVAVAMTRTVKPIPGVVPHRATSFEERVNWVRRPPRIALEHAAIEVAAAQRDVTAMFRVLADTCQTRETTAARIAAALRERRGVPRKAMLLELLVDLEAGACSVLEREYLRLERLHGLPGADRQRPATVGERRAYLDVPYDDYGIDVELDGRAYHDSAERRDGDFERDLENAVHSDTLTVRLTYGQVFRRGCHTIGRIAQLLERRGWTGAFRRCPNCPDLNAGASQ